MSRSSVTATNINWNEKVDGAIQAFTIMHAENALKAAVAKKQFSSTPTVITDGVPNRDYHQVRPYGRIEFSSVGGRAAVARWIMGRLMALSPYGPGRHGHYRERHIYMINGTEASDAALDRLQPSDTLQIVNTQPYAGKIEGRDAFTRWDVSKRLSWKKHGRKGNTRFGVRKMQGWARSATQGESSQAPNGVYRVVLGEAAQRFGKTIRIGYAPVQLSLNVTVWGQEGGPRSKFRKQPRKRIQRPQIYPCFVITSLQMIQ